MKRKPFVGRRAEMKLLNDALREANAGRGKIFMLAGEPGVGKTRLAEELCRPAERLGMDVAWSACFQDAMGPLYAPWTMVILALLGTRGATAIRRSLGAGSPAIAAVMPSIADALPKLPPLKPIDDPVSDRFRFSSSMSAFLSRASKERPILIVMDDLHGRMVLPCSSSPSSPATSRRRTYWCSARTATTKSSAGIPCTRPSGTSHGTNRSSGSTSAGSAAATSDSTSPPSASPKRRRRW